ncbi:Porphobilinogen synthase [Thermodesulfobacterium geofontis OPF15]|jgi:porphobilinogen synthase|uniref:Delta-aminolevulinic acid dehydratase n=1 Tax=Thermodesulfobacterium geofontis (strain OPF15) TaxID=795359 RepID=F8C471_THEGP|nr:porphobilinogen synthase [Thermodesulfobacterium geofontis]AEH22409.1 Porphobilinogen synthase [Thermodesulfobacterium geofontis OPF15]
MLFPEYRPRRLRRTENIRSLVRETHLTIDDLIYPLFICEGKNIKQEIRSMPEVYRFSIDKALEEIKEATQLGIKAVLLFGIPNKKDEVGTSAYIENGIIQKAVRAIKDKFPELIVITDVCLCEYTSHGHCGIIKNGEVDNDLTLEVLAKIAVSHAKAGADIVAPSDMMDGRVGRIREALDEAGFSHVAIMSYAVKYCSAFYGPFREAAESAPKFGDRRSYQMDPANSREALREASLDIEEGADIIMVKPAMPYLDIIKMLRNEFNYPLAAYQVSGEYAMIKAAAKLGWLDEEKILWESLISIKRAGADLIITYFAKKIAKKLNEK